MAIYYVALGGDGTDPTLDPTTNNWATAYDSLYDASVGLVAAGDFIYAAHDHNKPYIATALIVFPANTTILSVNRVTLAYEKGAIETALGGNDLDLKISQSLLNETLSTIGVSFSASDELDIIANLTGSNSHIEDATLALTNTGTGADFGLSLSDGSYIVLKNCDLDIASVGSATNGLFEIAAGSCVEFDGVKGVGTQVTNLIDPLGNGGMTFVARNTDFSTLLAVGGNFIDSGNSAHDKIVLEFTRCKLPSSFNWVRDGVWVLKNYFISLSSCDNGDGYHYFYQEDYSGIVEENLINYLAATYDKAQALGFSADLDSSANVGIGNPLKFKLGSLALDLTTSKTLKVNFTCANTLTDGEFWIEVTRPDATDIALGVVQSGRVTDILAGSLHTANAEAWTSGLTNTYEQSITIPALTGVDTAVVDVHVYLAKPLETVIVDPLIVVS